MHLLYNTALWPLRPFARIAGALAERRDPGRAREWAERCARIAPAVGPGAVWIHGASLGEARLTRSLAGALRERDPRLPLALSAVTRTGYDALGTPPDRAARFYLPIDIAPYQRRLLAWLRPLVLVLVETELWPNLLREAERAGVPVCLANARLAPERMGRYRTFGALYRPRLAALERVGAQSPGDAERFAAIGARPGALVVTGNLKYDLPAPAATRDALRSRFGLAAARPVLAAGSTGAGEDVPVLDAFESVRREVPDAFLILAPRHPERFGSAAREAGRRGLRVRRLADGDDRQAGGSDVLVVDVLGQLASLYAAADAAFVGGSLVPVGGHNVLEPAAAGVPVLFGPHTHHVVEPALTLLAAGGAKRVDDAPALAQAWLAWLRDPEAARRVGAAAASVLATHRGALDRTAAMVLDASR